MADRGISVIHGFSGFKVLKKKGSVIHGFEPRRFRPGFDDTQWFRQSSRRPSFGTPGKGGFGSGRGGGLVQVSLIFQKWGSSVLRRTKEGFGELYKGFKVALIPR
ncbi:hypothetical protein U1Q18_043163 [Sarracenia purpurea var. burkii]